MKMWVFILIISFISIALVGSFIITNLEVMILGYDNYNINVGNITLGYDNYNINVGNITLGYNNNIFDVNVLGNGYDYEI